MGVKNFYLKNKFWLVPVFYVLIIFVVFLPVVFWTPVGNVLSEPEKIKAFVLSFEKWALLVYVLLSILVIVAPPIPNEVVPIVGGIVFGFWKALLFGLLARIIGSTLNYYFGTKIRNGFLLKFLNIEDKQKLDHYTEKIGWQTVFISRFLPSVDTDLIAYIAGMAKMNYWKFILASFCGMVPVVTISVVVGASLLRSKYLFFILIAFYVVGMLFAPKIIKKFSKTGGKI